LFVLVDVNVVTGFGLSDVEWGLLADSCGARSGA